MTKTTPFKCTFFNNVHGLETDPVNIELSHDHNLHIISDEVIINKIFNEPLKLIVGRAQYQLAMDLKKFVFTTFKLPDDKNFDLVHAHLLTLSTLVSGAFWLVKDNAIRFNTGHFICEKDDILVVKSNTADGLYSDCHGNKITVYYNQAELIEALKYFEFIFNITLNKEQGTIKHTTSSANRINRAYYFIDLARKSFDIGTKISLHCSAFECLFSVSNAELRHRLSETIANLLGENTADKIELYKLVKEIYDLRSSVTHGSGVNKTFTNNNENKLKIVGTNCDNIMRKCLQKIISNNDLKDLYFRNNSEEIGNYFTDSLFA